MRTWHIALSHRRLIACLLFLPCCVATLLAGDQAGEVRFGGLPVPGATVTAMQGEKKVTALTDGDGKYKFVDLADGTWNIDVEMLCFESIKQDVTVGAGAMPSTFELKLLPLDQIKTFAAPPPPPEPARISVALPQATAPTPTAAAGGKASKNKKGAVAAAPANQQNSFQRAEVNANPNGATPASSADNATPNSSFSNQSPSELSQRASDGLLINGSQNNGASSAFAQSGAFGNNRRGLGSLYQMMLGMIWDNAALDAKSYSLTGQDTPKPGYNHIQGIASFNGPIRIPHIIQNGPVLFVTYQWMRNHTATTSPYLVPTEAQRSGDFSSVSPIYDPTNGAPFPGNQIPSTRFSPQALALLKYYPLPNFNPTAQYNYQIPIEGETHQDSLQTRLNKNIGNKNQVYGMFAMQRTAVDTPNQFGFLDKTHSLGTSSQVNWAHRLSPRTFIHFQAQYNRIATDLTPNFSNKENVSGNAGITGNNQEPINWGPPYLTFGSGITGLTDGVASSVHNQFYSFVFDASWTYGRHSITYGIDYKRTDNNNISQQNPRGTFLFNGAATAPPRATAPVGTPQPGSDFADFLLGIPDTSNIAYGNADKYFRSWASDAFVNDDWRIGPSLTFMAGVRWEYNSPITELYGRLVNLDVAPGFSAVSPVVASNPIGPVTGQHYPDSLLNPDKHAFQPRTGLAWRPIPASSLVVRAGYGVYYNTSVYQSIATLMAQQSPLSKSLSVQNSPATPLTLANGFNVPPNTFTNTFGIDPNFRVGYAQNYTASVQRDLPGSLVITATYLGIKGTRGPQQFLPNTYPTGTTSPCIGCATGFKYETSNGNSTRQSGRLQLRRRLRAGFTASLDYTFSKSIDDSALGGGSNLSYVIAQNWLDLSAERALSNFDQRHLLAFQTQYTTGQGLGGGALMSGWRGSLFKEWTVTTTVSAGTGMPLTPTILAAVSGTGVTGPIRPNYTGAPLYDAAPGYYINSAAFVAPPFGQWGNAGRNIITGPNQFSMNASFARTFRLKDKYSLDARIDATNVLNHVTFTAWNTILNSGQFGLPMSPANPMRSLQTTLRLRF
jgi:trimeric autotransporter adhesin